MGRRVAEQKLSFADRQLEAIGYTATKWWRAVDEDGNIIAETSDLDDNVFSILRRRPGVKVQKLYEKKSWRWVESNPDE